MLTKAGTRSLVYFSRPARSPGWTLPKIRAARMATVTTWMTLVTSWPRGTTRSSRPIFTPWARACSMQSPIMKVRMPLDW